QVVFVQLTTLGLENRIGKARATSGTISGGTSKFDLQINTKENNVGLEILIEYSTDLYGPATVCRMLRHYRALLQSVVVGPAKPIGDLEILEVTERRQILEQWNDTGCPYDRSTCIHQLFEQQVRLRPDAVALICGDSVTTYGDLNAQANQLAHYLRKHSFQPLSKLGILLRRSTGMVTALLGILKAGGMYLPLDPAFPMARITEVLQLLNIECLITESSLLPMLSERQDTLSSLKLLVLMDCVEDMSWESTEMVEQL